MEAFKEFLKGVGAASALARQLGVSHTAVYNWTKSRIPADRVVDIERYTGIPREALRPDLYKREPQRNTQ